MKSKLAIITSATVLSLASMTASFAGPSSALLVTPGNGEIKIDFSNENKALGIQFDLVLKHEGKLDLSACTAGLPKGVLGMCNQVGSVVKFAIASSEPLPTGQIGTIRFAGSASDVSVQKTVLADGSGAPASIESLVDQAPGAVNSVRK